MTEIPFAIVLGLASIIAALIAPRARKSARNYIAFAAALYAALAIGKCVAALGDAPALGIAIVFLVSALAPACLALALHASFSGRLHTAMTALVLALCVVFGIAAGLSNSALLAFAPLLASVCAMLAMALREKSLHAALGAGAFLAAAASFLAGGQTGFLLFSAAGLLGVASDSRVAGQRQTRSLAAIRGPR